MGTLEVVFLPADTLKIIAVRIISILYGFPNTIYYYISS